jgi:FkbM family methyltransferase
MEFSVGTSRLTGFRAERRKIISHVGLSKPADFHFAIHRVENVPAQPHPQADIPRVSGNANCRVEATMPSSSASDSLTLRTSWLVGGKTLAFAFASAVPIVLVRRMPQQEFGLYKQIFLVVSSAVTLLPLGFGMTAYYFLPRETEHRNHTVLNVVLFTSAVSALFGAVVTIFPSMLVLLFRESAVIGYAPWLAVVVVLWVVGSFLEIAIVANQEVRLASVAILGVQISRAALFVAAAALGGTIRAVLMAAVLQGVVQVAALWWYLESRFPHFWRSLDLRFLRYQLAYSLSFSIAGLLYSLQIDLHSYYVSHRFGSAAYAVYAIGCFQLPLFGILAESVGSVMIPRVSALEREGSHREVVLLTARAMCKLASIYFPAYALLFVVRREFIETLFTARYAASIPIFAVNLTLVPLGILITDPVMRAYPAHRQFLIKLHAAVLAGLIVTLPLAIDRFGLIGSVWTVVTFAFVARAATVLKICAFLNARPRDIRLLVDVGKAAAAATIAAVVVSFGRPALGTSSWVVLGLSGSAFGIIYLAAALAFGLVTEEQRTLARYAIRRVASHTWPVQLRGTIGGARIIAEQTTGDGLSIVPRLVRFYIRTHARGSTRGTFMLARWLKSLQTVPITINGTQQVYVDLRDGLSHDLLAGSPWTSVPWEVDEQLVMRRLVGPGEVVLDIGAHFGIHMVLLSALVGRDGVVHAFEANPSKRATLQATVARLDNTVLHPYGLSDVARRATFYVPEDETMASLSDWTEGRVGAVHRTECDVKRLDDLIVEGRVAAPDFIKCDVEGAEPQVFRGASQLLDRRDAPIVMFEVNARAARGFGAPISAAADFLRSLSQPAYSILQLQGDGRLVPIDVISDEADHFNLVAMPRARAHRLAEA